MEAGEAVIYLQQPMAFVVFVGLLLLYILYPIKIVVICLVTMIGIIICAYVWTRYLVTHVHATRQLRYAALQVGDELEENFFIRNSGWIPVLWIGIEDHSDFPAYSIDVIRALDGNSNVEWRVNLICKQRGVFHLGPWEWMSADPFGLFSVRRRYTNAQKMVVYPPLATLSYDLLPHGLKTGDHQQLNQPLMADSVQASQTRPYQPGDPLRRIHWRTTARHNNLFVKIFDPEASARIWLIPDLDPAVHTKDQTENWEDSSEETLILLMTALASQLVQEHRAVGLFAGVDPARVSLPQRGPQTLWTLLAEFASLHTTQSEDLVGVLTSAKKLISSNDVLIVMTPSTRSDWVFRLAEMTLRNGGREVWAYLLDPQDFKLQGDTRVIQSQAGELGINTRIIHPADIKPQIGSMGTLRKWEYLTLGTGKVVVRNRPRRMEELPIMEQEKWG